MTKRAGTGGGKRPPGREAKKPKKGRVGPATVPAITYSHPLYGPVPMISEEVVVESTGVRYTRHVWDPNYAPPLPPGAVRGNIREQVYCCDVPRYFYLDVKRDCLQCGRPFVFEAQEQKYWYEVLKFNFSSTALRCRACRQKRRSDRAIREGLARSKAAWTQAPNDPAVGLALAEATALYRERFGQGDADVAVGVARRVHKLRPELRESLYWEGRLHEAADRPGSALAAYERFLMVANGRREYASLVRDVERRVPRLAGSRIIADLPDEEATS